MRLILDFCPQTEREHMCGVLRFVSVTRTKQQGPMSNRGWLACPLMLPIPVPSHLNPACLQPLLNQIQAQVGRSPAFTICLKRQWADWKSPQGSHELEVKERTSLSTAEMNTILERRWRFKKNMYLGGDCPVPHCSGTHGDRVPGSAGLRYS